jgi:hypothetical protein
MPPQSETHSLVFAPGFSGLGHFASQFVTKSENNFQTDRFVQSGEKWPTAKLWLIPGLVFAPGLCRLIVRIRQPH